MTTYDRETQNGNHVVIVLTSDDIDRDYERVKPLGVIGLSDLVEVNLIAPYRFLQFQDPEGNIIEVGRME